MSILDRYHRNSSSIKADRQAELDALARRIKDVHVRRRQNLVHLARNTEGDNYTLGISDGNREFALTADNKNVKLSHKAAPTMYYDELESSDLIIARFLELPLEMGDSDARGWVAITLGAVLHVSVPFPLASFTWVYSDEVAELAEQMFDI